MLKDLSQFVIMYNGITGKRELDPVKDAGKTLNVFIDIFFFHTYSQACTHNASHTGSDYFVRYYMLFFHIMQDTQMRDAQSSATGKYQSEVIIL
jgi:hypothetical protein